MNCIGHLCLSHEPVPASDEWEPDRACWCFVRVVRGQGYWMDGPTALELGQGDALVLAPGGHGCFRASQLGPADLMHFRLCVGLLSGLLTLRELRHLDRHAAHGSPRAHRFPGSSPVAAAFAILDALPRPRHGLGPRLQMLQVAATFFDPRWPTSRGAHGAFLTSAQRIRVLVQQLTEGEVLAHSAVQLATRCHCSPRHFNRLFARQVGVSFRAKQAELRLQKARQLLLETNQPILQVSRATGYANPGVFHAQFLRHFGLTPSAWRKRHQSAGNPSEGMGAAGAAPQVRPP
ncbi:MAG: helix-turn-helix transcriptional regulator [Verrucomicrobia bacterium]|nr:helix-turn-helix transcriptional regulator [Verrucomicrobiota bacterium]